MGHLDSIFRTFRTFRGERARECEGRERANRSVENRIQVRRVGMAKKGAASVSHNHRRIDIPPCRITDPNPHVDVQTCLERRPAEFF